MGNPTFYIDQDNWNRLDYDGARNYENPSLGYAYKGAWDIKIRSMVTGTIAVASWADAVTFRAAVGQDFIHSAIDGALTADTSGAVTQIKADGFASAPPAAGYLAITNGAGETENVYYSEYSGTWASAATELTFVVNTTLTYVYLNNDDCDADNTPPLCRTTNANITSTDKANGNFTVTLDALNNVFKNYIDDDEKQDVYFELVGMDASGYEIHRVQIKIVARNSIDPSGGGTLAPPLAFIPKVLALTAAPNYNTTLASIDATAPVGSWGVYQGHKYTWHTAAENFRQPIEDTGY